MVSMRCWNVVWLCFLCVGFSTVWCANRADGQCYRDKYLDITCDYWCQIATNWTNPVQGGGNGTWYSFDAAYLPADAYDNSKLCTQGPGGGPNTKSFKTVADKWLNGDTTCAQTKDFWSPCKNLTNKDSQVSVAVYDNCDGDS